MLLIDHLPGGRSAIAWNALLKKCHPSLLLWKEITFPTKMNNPFIKNRSTNAQN